jgi:hypothetical protein
MSKTRRLAAILPASCGGPPIIPRQRRNFWLRRRLWNVALPHSIGIGQARRSGCWIIDVPAVIPAR